MGILGNEVNPMHRHRRMAVATEAQATAMVQRAEEEAKSECRSVTDRIGQYPARKRADLLQVRRRKAFANFNMALRVVCPQGPTFAQWVSTLEKVWQRHVTLRRNAQRLQTS